MTTKDQEKRTSVKLRESTLKMLQDEGTFTETYDEVIRRLLFVRKTGSAEKTPVENKIERLI